MKKYLQKHFENIEFKKRDEVRIIYTGSSKDTVKVKFDKEGKAYYKDPNPNWTVTNLHIFRNEENISWKVSESGVVWELMQRMKYNFKNDLEVELSKLEKKYFTEDDFTIFTFGFLDDLQKEDKDLRVKAMTNTKNWGRENNFIQTIK